jgi:hypothetical protein
MGDDKKLHFLCGCIISLLVGLYNPTYGLLAGMVAGLAKEVYDYIDYGGPDIKDFLATAVGSILGALVSEVMPMLV